MYTYKERAQSKIIRSKLYAVATLSSLPLPPALDWRVGFSFLEIKGFGTRAVFSQESVCDVRRSAESSASVFSCRGDFTLDM